jgi:hypothetical protein
MRELEGLLAMGVQVAALASLVGRLVTALRVTQGPVGMLGVMVAQEQVLQVLRHHHNFLTQDGLPEVVKAVVVRGR